MWFGGGVLLPVEIPPVGQHFLFPGHRAPEARSGCVTNMFSACQPQLPQRLCRLLLGGSWDLASKARIISVISTLTAIILSYNYSYRIYNPNH